MRVSRTISIYRAQRSQQGCSLSLGMLRLADPPTGRARLRSSLKSPRPSGARPRIARRLCNRPHKVTRPTKPPVLPSIAYRGFAVAPMTLRAPADVQQTLDFLTHRPPSLREGDRPQAVEGVSPIICPSCAACAGHMIFFVSEELEWAGRTGRTAGKWHERRFLGTNDPSASIRRRTDCGIIGV